MTQTINPLADDEREELARLRIFRECAIQEAITAGETMARQELRIEQLQQHLVKIHDVMWNAIANGTHLLPQPAPAETKQRYKPNPERIRRQSAKAGAQ